MANCIEFYHFSWSREHWWHSILLLSLGWWRLPRSDKGRWHRILLLFLELGGNVGGIILLLFLEIGQGKIRKLKA